MTSASSWWAIGAPERIVSWSVSSIASWIASRELFSDRRSPTPLEVQHSGRDHQVQQRQSGQQVQVAPCKDADDVAAMKALEDLMPVRVVTVAHLLTTRRPIADLSAACRIESQHARCC